MNRLESVLTPNLTGCLLVAAPDWNDSLFQQSVCLVINHNEQGAIGVLLNKLINIDPKSFWQQLGAQIEGSQSSRLFLGGPQAGPVVAMHQRQDLAEFISADGVYFAAQLDSLKQLVADSHSQCKIFVGQASWNSGELDRQFAAGNWLPLRVQSRVVFEAAESMWRVALRDVGNRLVEAMIGTQVLPNVEYN